MNNRSSSPIKPRDNFNYGNGGSGGGGGGGGGIVSIVLLILIIWGVIELFGD